jgi:hypothetical protein
MIQSQDNDRNRSLSTHILPASGTMIGVCTTLIGLVKVIEVKNVPSHVDEYAALASLFFLASAIASYISMQQTGHPRFSNKCELVADRCFLVGLVSIALIAILFAHEVI